MKPIYVVLAAIAGLLLIVFLGYYNLYNSAVRLQEGVNEKWGNVQSAYQRRADLVPNLVETVKGAAKNEQEILTKVRSIWLTRLILKFVQRKTFKVCKFN